MKVYFYRNKLKKNIIYYDMVDIIFIVPYRDREQHKFYFLRHMEYVLEDYDYEIIFVNQKDTRPFNRGAMKKYWIFICQKKIL